MYLANIVCFNSKPIAKEFFRYNRLPKIELNVIKSQPVNSGSKSINLTTPQS